MPARRDDLLRPRLARELRDEPTSPDERYFHGDLPELDLECLRAEVRRLKLAEILEARTSEWARDRIARLEDAIELRHGGQSHGLR